jgi:hypothetical protein
MATSGSQKARAAVEAAVSLKQLQNSSLVGARALLEELTGQNQQKSQIHPAGIKKERKPMPGKRSSGNGSSAKKRSSTANHFSKPRIG